MTKNEAFKKIVAEVRPYAAKVPGITEADLQKFAAIVWDCFATPTQKQRN